MLAVDLIIFTARFYLFYAIFSIFFSLATSAVIAVVLTAAWTIGKEVAWIIIKILTPAPEIEDWELRGMGGLAPIAEQL